jgi:hypothetical protein
MVEKWVIVKGFWCMALDYFAAERALPDESTARFGLVPHYLLCHSLELSFKAFLADKGNTIEDMRKRFNHDLGELLRECEANGLAASFPNVTELRTQIRQVNKYYSEKQFEYGEISIYDLPELKALRDSSSKLISVTEPLWTEPEREAAQKR